jgi:hypothetical protein
MLLFFACSVYFNVWPMTELFLIQFGHIHVHALVVFFAAMDQVKFYTILTSYNCITET